MENRSFEEGSAKDNPPKDSEEKPPNPSKEEPQGETSGIGRDQSKEADVNVIDEEDESPPAYVKRYMQEEPKRYDLEDLEPPVAEAVQEPCDVRLDPEFQQQARNRRARRARQNLVEGPCALHPDPPNLVAPDEPAEYINPQQEQNPQPPALAPTPPAPTSRTMSERMNSFSFQFPFHTLLLTWPLATAVMGILNLSVCQMNKFLPAIMLTVGLLGTFTTLLRLYTLFFEKRVTNQDTRCQWTFLRGIELVGWDMFIAQLYYFFKQPPSDNPNDENYCKWRFYKINCAVMLLSSITMLGWMMVHLPKLIRCLKTQVPKLVRWIVRRVRNRGAQS